MELTNIVKGINKKLAGELCTYEMLRDFMDEVIDDINAKLNSNYPAFSEFTSNTFPEKYPNYDFFPDRYIRSVVIIGSAYKYYITDEEGINSATQYGYDYSDALFLMERDWSENVPAAYQSENTSSLEDPAVTTEVLTVPFDSFSLF